MKIQVLGSGCPTCQKLYDLTKKAVEQLGIKNEVEYISGDKGIQTIIEMELTQSPVLVINGKPVLIGFTADIEKIKKIIASNN